MDVISLGILVADSIARPVEALPAHGSLALVEEVTLRGGGCAVNTASVLAGLGLDAGVAGKVGLDPFGDFLLGLLDSRGVDRAGVVVDPAVPTAASVVLVDSAGARPFLHLPGANGRLRREDLDTELLFATRALHLAGALVMPALDGEPTAQLLAEARGHAVLTSLDTVWDATGRWERVVPARPLLDDVGPRRAAAPPPAGARAPAAPAAGGGGRAPGAPRQALPTSSSSYGHEKVRTRMSPSHVRFTFVRYRYGAHREGRVAEYTHCEG
jgi:hypothetical protein